MDRTGRYPARTMKEIKTMDKLMTTEAENLQNRIKYLEGEIKVLREKAKVLTQVPPITIRLDAATKQVAQDIVDYINGIGGIDI